MIFPTALATPKEGTCPEKGTNNENVSLKSNISLRCRSKIGTHSVNLTLPEGAPAGHNHDLFVVCGKVYMVNIRIFANRLVTVSLPEGDSAGHSHDLFVHHAICIIGVV